MSESLSANEIVAELRNDIQEQNKQLDEAYAEIDAKDKLLKEKEKEIAALKKAAAAGGGDAGESLSADQIVEDLRNDIKEQNQQLEEAYAAIDAKDKQIADLKKQLAAAGSGGVGGGGGGSSSSAADKEEIRQLKEKVAKLKASMNALLDA